MVCSMPDSSCACAADCGDPKIRLLTFLNALLLGGGASGSEKCCCVGAHSGPAVGLGTGAAGAFHGLGRGIRLPRC
jgi:hypothetical protein